MHNNDETSLKNFIYENDKLLSVLGVFAAIFALTYDSKNFIFSIISFLSLSGLIIVGFEIWINLPKRMSLALLLFHYVILWSGISFITYWVYTYRIWWNIFLFIPMTLMVFAFIFGTLLPIVRYFSFFRKLFGVDLKEKKMFQNILRASSISILIIFSLIIGVQLAFGTNIIFNVFYNQFGS